MKRLLLSCACAAALVLAALPALAAEYPEPQGRTFDPALLEKIKQADAVTPWSAGMDCGRADLQTLDLSMTARPAEGILVNDDNDGAHYARGRTLVIHIFINHTGGTWSAAEMDAAGAKATSAKNRYLSHAPDMANLYFDYQGGTGYWYYSATLGYNIPNDGVTWTTCDDALVALGFTDTDGDGSPCDQLTKFLLNWGGGWDNVLMVFQPADITGRAYASYGCSRCVQYTDDVFSVWWHEWGHLFGSCDEYVEGGHCNGGIDCGACQGTYLSNPDANRNCALVACPSNVDCVMRYNNDAVCNSTLHHWGWIDDDANGLADNALRRVSGASFVNIWELYHNGWFYWNNTANSEVLSQRWTSWMACGLRSPATTDYDLVLYGENNHDYAYASSSYGGTMLDFVVADYNHTGLGNEHLQINKWSGASDAYNLTFESGNEVLYPDGVVRSQSWADYNTVRVWDLPLFAGETVTITVDVTSGTPDFGVALFKSSGTTYYAGRGAAVASANAGGAGATEYLTYTVPEDDVYGLVVWEDVAAAGDFTIQVGPSPYTLAEESPFLSALDLRLFNYIPNAGYWAYVASRPEEAATDVDLLLFADANYVTPLEEATLYGVGGTSMEWIVVDYNHVSLTQDYLRVVKVAGAGNHRTMWEHDPESISGTIPTATWTSTDLGKVWDTFLSSGTDYLVREYSGGPTFDNALYLYGSSSGDYYQPRQQYLALSNQPPASGGEWLRYSPSVSDWYGLIMPVFSSSSESYSIWMGPEYTLAEDVAATRTNEVVWGNNAVTVGYWTVYGVRPSPGGAASVWLYGDHAYTITSLAVSDQFSTGVRFVVADNNHVPTGTVYPRFRLESGSSMRYEWEGGSEAYAFAAGSQLAYALSWPAGDVAKAYDLYVPAGAHLGISVEVLSGALDLGVELFDSNAAAYHARRGGGVARSDALGVGGTESLHWINGPAADWTGLVIFNKNENGGTFRLRIVDAATVSVGDDPQPLALSASPNPFVASAALRFSLPSEQRAELAIYDLQGRLVRTLASGLLPAGRHEASWDGRDAAGHPAATGVYLARLQAGAEQRVVKLVRGR
jgi:hypothetical protein